MILSVAGDRDLLRIDTGIVEQHHCYRHGPGRRQIPIGSKGSVVDRHIVSMPFYPHIEAVLHQHFRDTLDLISCARHEPRFPTVEESEFMKADQKSFRGHAQDNLLTLDLLAQGLVEFPL